MLRFLFAFLLAAPLVLGQVEIEPFIDASGVSITPGTAGAIPKWNAVPDDFVDSLLSDDGTNVTLASGQFLLPDGLVGAPALAFTNVVGTGLFANGATTLDFAMGGATVLRIRAGSTRVPDGNAGEAAVGFISDTDTGPYRIGANNFGVTVGGALVLDIEDTNAAGASADLVTISSELGIMDDPTDLITGLLISLTNANHTGGQVNGIRIDSFSADGNATEAAIGVVDGWDVDISHLGDDSIVQFASGTSATWRIQDGNDDVEFWLRDPNNANLSYDVVEFDINLKTVNGSNTLRGLFIDIENKDHTGTDNLLIALDVDGIVQDADAFESAARFGSGFDAHFTLVERGGAYADTPPAGSIGFYLDANADWSGGGGNDCALIGETSGGATTVIAILVTNGGC